ncbi:MAG: TetR/AcrR family transcriptional regulator, partial [Pseudohongiellaceae bacterium]
MKTAEKARSVTQARGRERRQRLIESARTLLDVHRMDELSLADIASHAGIPTGSAYHFFPNVTAVYQALGERFSEELDAELAKPYQISLDDDWLSIIDEAIDRAHRFYEASAG